MVKSSEKYTVGGVERVERELLSMGPVGLRRRRVKKGEGRGRVVGGQLVDREKNGPHGKQLHFSLFCRSFLPPVQE